jgi:beta-phosphoglucomutase-like phosphatase (HAD superfamily)
VLFDVDGTLVDTNYLHAVTWWQAFAQAGHYVPMANIHRAIGMGSDQMLDQLLPVDRDKDADTGLRMSHDALYATYWTRLRPLPGAVELLRACKARGLAVVLASSAGEFGRRGRVRCPAGRPRCRRRHRRRHVLRRG